MNRLQFCERCGEFVRLGGGMVACSRLLNDSTDKPCPLKFARALLGQYFTCRSHDSAMREKWLACERLSLEEAARLPTYHSSRRGKRREQVRFPGTVTILV